MVVTTNTFVIAKAFFEIRIPIQLVFVFIFVFWRDHNGNQAPKLFCVIPVIMPHVLLSNLIKNF